MTSVTSFMYSLEARAWISDPRVQEWLKKQGCFDHPDGSYIRVTQEQLPKLKEHIRTLQKEDMMKKPKTYWMIRNASGHNITKPFLYVTEEQAWNSVIREPFGMEDYQQKGYYAVKEETTSSNL